MTIQEIKALPRTEEGIFDLKKGAGSCGMQEHLSGCGSGISNICGI